MSQAYAMSKSTHPLAVISLVLSLLGFTPVLPLIGSIAGIVTGNIARRSIAREAQYGGEGLAKTAVVLGWIAVGLAALAVIGALLFLLPLTVRLG